jgi:pyruvate/2-oxoglutarate dehydrogenase complex dihydrolipoamide acyltransferase (E2) component
VTVWKGAAEVALIVGFNHDLIDGAPAARFIRRLIELIESGYGFVCASLTDEWRPG